MIFSVTEQREALLAIDERRRQIAAEQAGSIEPATTVTALVAGAAVPSPGPVVAVKAAAPEIGKGRKKGKGKDRARRDMTPGETAHAAVGQGYRDAMAEQAAGDDAGAAKSFRDQGITEGPGRPVQPATPPPAESFSRPYLDGIAAASPQHEGPRTSPMPNLAPGQVTAVTLPAAPMAQNVSQHVAGQFTGGSPSER